MAVFNKENIEYREDFRIDEWQLVADDQLICIFGDHSIRVLDLQTKDYRIVFSEHTSIPLKVDVHLSGLLVSSSKHECVIWRLADGSVVKKYPLPSPMWEPLGHQRRVLHSSQNLLLLHNMQDEDQIAVLDLVNGRFRPSIILSQTHSAMSWHWDITLQAAGRDHLLFSLASERFLLINMHSHKQHLLDSGANQAFAKESSDWCFFITPLPDYDQKIILKAVNAQRIDEPPQVSVPFHWMHNSYDLAFFSHQGSLVLVGFIGILTLKFDEYRGFGAETQCIMEYTRRADLQGWSYAFTNPSACQKLYLEARQSGGSLFVCFEVKATEICFSYDFLIKESCIKRVEDFDEENLLFIDEGFHVMLYNRRRKNTVEILDSNRLLGNANNPNLRTECIMFASLLRDSSKNYLAFLLGCRWSTSYFFYLADLESKCLKGFPIRSSLLYDKGQLVSSNYIMSTPKKVRGLSYFQDWRTGKGVRLQQIYDRPDRLRFVLLRKKILDSKFAAFQDAQCTGLVNLQSFKRVKKISNLVGSDLKIHGLHLLSADRANKRIHQKSLLTGRVRMIYRTEDNSKMKILEVDKTGMTILVKHNDSHKSVIDIRSGKPVGRIKIGGELEVCLFQKHEIIARIQEYGVLKWFYLGETLGNERNNQ